MKTKEEYEKELNTLSDSFKASNISAKEYIDKTDVIIKELKKEHYSSMTGAERTIIGNYERIIKMARIFGCKK